MKPKILIVSAFILLMSVNKTFSQTFNKNKDLLLANFDLLPDDDDVQASAALASMLKHPDFDGVNYYAVAGAYGKQKGFTFINLAVPNYFNTLFGSENVNWTNADKNWNASVNRVKNRVVGILNKGGKVWVQEGGQSDFTHDVVRAAIKDGISSAIIRKNVIVVQHSNWNQNNTTTSKLNWLKANADYRKIPDGNSGGNGSAEYKSTNKRWMNEALSSTNADARKFWTMAKNISDDWTTYNNPAIRKGGVDFSDCVENWYIFNLGANVDDVGSFWNRYVTNKKGTGNNTTTVHITKRNASNFAIDGGRGGKNGQNIYLWSSNSSSVNQQWNEISRGNGFYSYQKKGTNFCIDGGNRGANKQNVYLWSCKANNQNQHWQKVSTGSGNFKLIKRNASGYAIDGGNGGANRQNIALYNSSNRSQNLQWRITPVNTVNKTIVLNNTTQKFQGLELYPNPVKDVLNIEFKGEAAAFSIVNLTGQKVYSGTIKKGNNKLELGALSKGMYIMKIVNGEDALVQKIIRK